MKETPKIDRVPTRNSQTVPSRVIPFRIHFAGLQIYERLQAFQLPTRDAGRDLARATRRPTFLHSRWHKVHILCVCHAPQNGPMGTGW